MVSSLQACLGTLRSSRYQYWKTFWRSKIAGFRHVLFVNDCSGTFFSQTIGSVETILRDLPLIAELYQAILFISAKKILDTRSRCWNGPRRQAKLQDVSIWHGTAWHAAFWTAVQLAVKLSWRLNSRPSCTGVSSCRAWSIAAGLAWRLHGDNYLGFYIWRAKKRCFFGMRNAMLEGVKISFLLWKHHSAYILEDRR